MIKFVRNILLKLYFKKKYSYLLTYKFIIKMKKFKN